MKRLGWTLLPGIFVSMVFLVIAWATGQWRMVAHVTGIIGLVFLICGMILSGALVSGDRMRANDRYETKENRRMRQRWSTNFLLLCLPYFATSGALYLWVVH